MSVRPTRTIRSSLAAKGFVEDNSHHHYFWLHVDGERTHIRTHYSHGARECDDRLLHSMAEQLGLSKRQFCDLIPTCGQKTASWFSTGELTALAPKGPTCSSSPDP